MNNHKFLEGVKVLDLSQYIPGPFATRQLADLGAEVIKIEPPFGDPMRRILYQGKESVSPVYQHLNRGKKIAFVDLKSDSGKTVFRDLVVDANVLLESFRPGVLDRLGFDREALNQINPALIYCSLSGYGQTGPYRQRSGHDINYLAASGALIASGIIEKPVMTFPPVADHAGALQASSAILAALYRQHKDGSGCFLDISIFESILAWQYLPYFDNADKRGEGLLSGGAACYNIYQCADDEFISIGALEPHFWRNFCLTVGKSGWIDRQQEDLPQEKLIGEIQNLFLQHPRSYWDSTLDNCDCCYHPLVFSDELTEQSQIKARSSFSHTGPGFPGLINDENVAVENEIKEIEINETPRWS